MNTKQEDLASNAEVVCGEQVDPLERELELEIEAALEAILFVSGEPVPVDRLMSVFRKKDAPMVQSGLARLRERYGARDDSPERGLIFDEAGGGLRLVTRPDLHGHLRKYFEVSGSNRMTMAALETLAIVAYRQPITLPEIQELRGRNSSGVMKTLLDRRLIRISGRKDVVGKPFLYATTRDFLLHFGLSRVEDLPPLEEFEETFGVESAEAASDLVGGDREEHVLQQLALVEEKDQEESADEERAEIEQEREQAEQEEPVTAQDEDLESEPDFGETEGTREEVGNLPSPANDPEPLDEELETDCPDADHPEISRPEGEEE